MVIRLCKMKTNVKPKLYVSLDIIPAISMNGTKPWSKPYSKWIPTTSNYLKRSKTVKNYRKWVKISIFFYKQSEIQKFLYHLNFLLNVVHLSSKLQKQIQGASSNGIPPHLIQVDSHAPLFHFDAIFKNIYGLFNFLSHPNLCVSAHAEIGPFYAYRARHTQKMHQNPCTYVAILQTVAYAAMHMIFQVK